MKNKIFGMNVCINKVGLAKIWLPVALGLASVNAVASEVDNRQILDLTESQRHYVLTEMRDLLAGTQNILAALAKNDMAAVAEHARALGFDMKHKAENPLHHVLPKEFMQIGMPMHKEFDVIAADAAALKDPKHTLQQLSATMGKCIACHATYQVQVTAMKH